MEQSFANDVQTEEILKERLQCIINNTHNLLSIKLEPALTLNLLNLFDQATQLQKVINHIADHNKLSESQQRAVIYEETIEQLKQFQSVIDKYEQQAKSLQTSKKSLKDLISKFNVNNCQLKETSSLLQTNRLISRQVSKLQEQNEQFKNEIDQNKKQIELHYRQEDEMDDIAVDQIHEQNQRKIKQKQSELQHMQEEYKKKEGEEQFLIKKYQELLNQQNKNIVDQLRDTPIRHMTQTANADDVVRREPTIQHKKGCEIVKVRVIKDKPKFQLQHIFIGILTVATVVLLIMYLIQ